MNQQNTLTLKKDLDLVVQGRTRGYAAPETLYFKTKAEFDEAVGKDFIQYVNELAKEGKPIIVALSHGISPSGPYYYIYKHYAEIKQPELIYYCYVNSPVARQRDLNSAFNAARFLKQLLKRGLLTKDKIWGSSLSRDNLETYSEEYNESFSNFLQEHDKEGYDYAFLACTPRGSVAAITRQSAAFHSDKISVVVYEGDEIEVTVTPQFLMQTKRIAFLATKADKRRALAWLFSKWGKPNESPSFLRHMDNVEERMTVFIDDNALTWPQIQVNRETPYGTSEIRIDIANPYEEYRSKQPVVLFIHGFLGLNSFDGLLAALPSHKYLAAAMHYGSVPYDLPKEQYSQHVVKNIDAAVSYFGSKGHPVYLFDHSMGNIYFLMIDRDFDELEGIKKYLHGRIGSNPFFGGESKHALLGFMDNVIIPSAKASKNTFASTMLQGFRRVIPFDSKKSVRKRGINLAKWFIHKDSALRDRAWKAAQERMLYLMSNFDSLPRLNRVPIKRALSRVPVKIFAIQVYSALLESISFEGQMGLTNMHKHNIPVLILKSEKDAVAKYVHSIYHNENNDVKVIDITDYTETDLFREHLYHMVHPFRTTKIIDTFIKEAKKIRRTKR